jgi:hypothetical protein
MIGWNLKPLVESPLNSIQGKYESGQIKIDSTRRKPLSRIGLIGIVGLPLTSALTGRLKKGEPETKKSEWLSLSHKGTLPPIGSKKWSDPIATERLNDAVIMGNIRHPLYDIPAPRLHTPITGGHATFLGGEPTLKQLEAAEEIAKLGMQLLEENYMKNFPSATTTSFPGNEIHGPSVTTPGLLYRIELR